MTGSQDCIKGFEAKAIDLGFSFMKKINSWADITVKGSSRVRVNEVTRRRSKLEQSS